MKNFFIKTFGCKTNQIESQIIENRLIKAGYKKSEKDFEILLVNSCTVTNIADSKCLQFLRAAKNANPNIKTVLLGCMAQYKKEELKKHGFIDLILGNEEKLNIEKYLSFDENYVVGDIFKVKEFQNYEIEKLSRTRANLKIQDGCNNKCSYCAINLARGKSRSNKLENILKQIETLTQNGYKEIILTGIHLNLWGHDLSPKQTLCDLIRAVEKTDIERYRIGSLYPNELTDELLEVLKKSKKFCPHFHLSLQSMNTKILKLMNRHYTSELCIEKIKKIKDIFPTSFIGADIIVGFPTETDEDFKETMQNIENLPFSNLHIFPYSKRENTPAATMEGQIPENIKKERAKKLKVIAEKKYQDFLEQNVGHELSVLVEKVYPDKACGLSGNYIEVEIPIFNKTVDKNTIVKVFGKNVNKNKLIAELL
ncbi:tRNA (N(6)-L-threonylcarbamoyladenosine(37)-C(2))-methylthiotransferase MtaB [bacterium]|nr:tRNA (N(6)-L-threonylcarbamoyladenosine(37)-C(2))-methylthiotransferase MtaB [bacterium]